MYRAVRPLIYTLNPESAHSLVLTLLARAPLAAPVLSRALAVRDPRLHVRAFGVDFINPVGLAAGYDKNAAAVRGLAALGFGHLELGTVTLKPQGGNARPRLHRLPAQESLINSLGFPNVGVEAFVRNLERTRQGEERWGVNIGKGKDTPLEAAAGDYVELLKWVAPRADYVAVNISSPNTLGLRQLQTKTYLRDLLAEIIRARNALSAPVPVLVKLSPDMTAAELDDALEALLAAPVDGLIAANTTLSREGVPPNRKHLPGGLSGQLLTERATATIRHLARAVQGRLPIIGVGGIHSLRDALHKIHAGATLIQLYTGLIYEGPALVNHINRGLLKAMDRAGAANLDELRAALTL